MTIQLTTTEARVLGCLVEKDLATPEYYPLTVNALVNACNQKSNRDPVMTLGEGEVQAALDSLRAQQLAHRSAEGVRAAKFCHNLEGPLKLEPAEMAVLAELLLRGPQTLGELRSRADRMVRFADLAAVEETVGGLMDRDQPLLARLPRQPGRKEHRYVQLLTGLPAEEPEPAAESAPEVVGGAGRLAELEQEVAALREELTSLRQEFAAFRAEFD